MTTEEYKRLVAKKEAVADAYAKMQSEKLRVVYENVIKNIIAGVCYKFDIPKNHSVEFSKYCSKILLESANENSTTAIEDMFNIIKICEESVEKFKYNTEFQEIIDK